MDLKTNFYHPHMKLRKGNVFTSVCQEFCPRGVYPSMHWGVYRSMHWGGCGRPPRADTTSWADTSLGRPPPTAIAADGTNPTGMHSCCKLFCWIRLMLWKILDPPLDISPYIKPDMPINVYTRFCLNTAKSKFSLVSPVADWWKTINKQLNWIVY